MTTILDDEILRAGIGPGAAGEAPIDHLRRDWTPVVLLLLLLPPPGCGRGDSRPERGDPQKIVVMAPAAAEMLEALGTSDRVVGIGDYVLGPPSIAGLPRVGAYDSPNVERVLSLGADVLITASSQAGADAHRRLSSLGVRVLALDTSTYDGVFTSLEEVGRLLGREERARELEREIRGRLRSIRARAEGLDRPRVLFVVGREPLYVAGPGSHVDEMISLAGGTNVMRDVDSPYARVSMEVVLERMPEVIIDVSDNRPGAPRGRLPGDWGQWEFLPAVERNRVYRVDPSRLTIPGIRLPQMTLLMGRLIHPEVFGEAADDELRAPER